MSVVASQLVGEVSIKGAEKAKEDLTQVGTKTDTAQKGLSQLKNKSEETGASLASHLTGGLRSAVGGFLQFGSQVGMTIFGLQSLGQSLVGLVGNILAPNASMEQTTTAFTQLLGGAKAANKEIASLSKMAADTPFEFPDLANSEQQLIAFQIPLKQTHPLLLAIGDALSGLGKNTPATLDQVVQVFGQMNAAGKIQTQDLMQLTSVGINGFQLLANQMHKPVSVIKDMVTNGTIPASKGIEMLRAGMEKTFGGGMAAQAKTFNGLLSTFQDNIGAAWRTFTGPLFDAAKSGLQRLGDLVASKAFQDFATTLGRRIAGAFQSIGSFLSGSVLPGFQRFGDLLARAWAILDDEGLGVLVASLQNLGATIASSVGPALQWIGNLFGEIFSSGNVLGAAHALEGEFYNIADAVDEVSGDIRSFTALLQGNSIQAQMVKDAMLGLGASLVALKIGSLVQAIPGVIAGLRGWAVSAATASAASLPLILASAGITLAVGGIILAVQHWGEISAWLQDQWKNVQTFFAQVGAGIQRTVQGMVQWFNDWKPVILTVSGILLTFFGPALIKAGVEASIAGAKITADFIRSIVTTGAESSVAGAKTTASFIKSVVVSGYESVIAGAKISGQFIANMVKSGIEAVVNGAKITGQFVAGLIKTGVEGWAAAGKLAIFTGGLIKAGVESVIAGAKIAAQFVASIAKAGVQAVITGSQFVASLIPSLISIAADGIAAVVVAMPGLIGGLIGATVAAWGFTAALLANPITWIVLAIIALIGIIILLATHWSQVTAAVGAAMSGLGTVVHNVVLAIGGWFSALGNWAHELWNRIVAIFGNVAGWFHDRWNQAINGVKNILSGLGSFAQGVWNGITGGLKAAFNGVLGFINGAIDAVNNVTGKVGIPPIPHIPLLAKGTDYWQGGPAMLGEAGEPEVVFGPRIANIVRGSMVVPASKLQGGGASPTIIVQSGPIYLDGKQVSKGVLPHMVSEIRNRTGVVF